MKPWTQTVSGRAVDLSDPHPDQIHIADIAWSLAHLCRFNGHLREFYSVAEHSVLMLRSWHRRCAKTAPPPPLPDLRAALLHDGPEAYIGDITSPVKRLLGVVELYEDPILRCICKRYDATYPLPETVKRLDLNMLELERTKLMGPPPRSWELPEWVMAEPIELQLWDPRRAFEEFLDVAAELGIEGADEDPTGCAW